MPTDLPVPASGSGVSSFSNLPRTPVTCGGRGEGFFTTWSPPAGTLVVGLAGHGGVFAEDTTQLQEKATLELTRLREQHAPLSPPAILLTTLREGSERLVASLVTGDRPRVHGYRLVVLLRPVTPSQDALRFASASGATLANFLSHAHEALVLQGPHSVASATSVATLDPVPPSEGETPDQERTRLDDESLSRSAARHAAIFVAEQSHHLLACWDGVKTGGQELTSETVYQALDRRRLGISRGRLGNAGSVVIHLSTRHQKNVHPAHAAWSVRHLTMPQIRIAAPLSTRERLWAEGTMQVIISVACAMMATLLGSFGFYQFHKDQLLQRITPWDAFCRAAALPLLEGLDLPRWRDMTPEEQKGVTSPSPRPGPSLSPQGPPPPPGMTFEGAALTNELNHVELEIPPALQWARIFGVITPGLVTLFGLHFWLGRKRQDLKIARWTLRRRDRRRPYAVICGLGWKGWELLHDLKRRGYRVGVVEKNASNPSLSAAKDMGGVAVLVGDCTDPLLLGKLRPHKAEKIFLVSGDEEINVRAASAVAEEVERCWRLASDREGGPKSWRVRCNTDMHGRGRIALMEATSHEKQAIELRAFSTEETTSRSLLKRHPIDRFLHKASDASSSPSRDAQVIILGDSPMARAILRLTLHQAESGTRESLRLTVMASDPVHAARDFLHRYPIYSLVDSQGRFKPSRFLEHPDFLSAGLWLLRPIPRWHAVDVHDEDSLNFCPPSGTDTGPAGCIAPQEQVLPELEFLLLPEPGPVLLSERSPLFSLQSPERVTTVYVCIDDGPANARWLQSFLPKLDRIRAAQKADTQVFYHFTAKEHRLPVDFERHVSALAPWTPVTGFGDYLWECSARAVESERLDIFAKLVNYCYSDPADYLPPDGSCEPRLRGREQFEALRERAEAAWSHTRESDRDSSRMCADHLELKLRSIDIDTDDESVAWEVSHEGPLPAAYQDLAARVEANITRLSITEHRRWCADRLLEGFRYAETKDKSSLRTPALVPWSQLSAHDQRKDLDIIRGTPQFFLDERLWRSGL